MELKWTNRRFRLFEINIWGECIGVIGSQKGRKSFNSFGFALKLTFFRYDIYISMLITFVKFQKNIHGQTRDKYN